MQTYGRSSCLLCPCTCAPFCRSNFCLAQTILCFCVFSCDPGVFRGLASDTAQGLGMDHTHSLA
jgi:hypothetical protein